MSAASFSSFSTRTGRLNQFFDAPASSPRSSRLLLASAIACSTLALALAFAFAFERMTIFRVSGPKTRFELAAVVIADPPKIVEPPPPPETLPAEGTLDGDPSPLTPRAERPSVAAIVESDPSGSDDAADATLMGSGRSIPGPGVACPGGICPKGPIGIPGGVGTGACPSGKCLASVAKQPAPKPLPFSAMSCIACADPDMAALRRTSAGIQKSAGTNVTRFCVDTSGHVEANSVTTQTSHGDLDVDRVCREAVKHWRFTPIEVDGEKRRSCSQASFSIQFK